MAERESLDIVLERVNVESGNLLLAQDREGAADDVVQQPSVLRFIR